MGCGHTNLGGVAVAMKKHHGGNYGILTPINSDRGPYYTVDISMTGTAPPLVQANDRFQFICSVLLRI